MKDVKRQVNLFSFYDRSGVEAHLAQMAEKGWRLEKIGQIFWTYRKMEPQKLTFSVCYFPKASQFDPEPSEEQETFYDFCAHTGWVLAASNAQLQIFYNERPDPVPIQTDPVQEVETIHRAMKRSFLPSQLLLAGLGILSIGIQISNLKRDPIEALSNPSTLASILCWAIVFLLIAVEVVSYLRWHRKAVRAAEQGEFYETKSHQTLQWGCLILILLGLGWYFFSTFATGNRMMQVLLVLMFLIYFPGLFLLVNGIKGSLKKQGASAGINRVVTFVGSCIIAIVLVFGVTIFAVSVNDLGWFQDDSVLTYEYEGRTYTLNRDPAPLTLEDLLEGDFSRYTLRWRGNQSLLLGQYTCNQWPIGPVKLFPEELYLDYVVTLVKVPALYDMCREIKLHERDDWGSENPRWQGSSYVSSDPTPWGAVEAYRWQMPDGTGNQFLLFYEDRIVEFSLSFYSEESETTEERELTQEQMELVGEKLRNIDRLP